MRSRLEWWLKLSLHSPEFGMVAIEQSERRAMRYNESEAGGITGMVATWTTQSCCNDC
jgi:hypothetical protein